MSLSDLFSKSGLLGLGGQSPGLSVGDPITAKVDAIVQGTAAAREKLAALLPAQSGVGRAMRAFNSAGNPIAGVVNMIGSFFKGSKYRSDQYRLGEKYMLYVLGMDIHSYRKVEDGVVPEAQEFFTQLLGVPIESWTGVEELKRSVEEFRRVRGVSSSQSELERAQKLLNSLPFNDQPGAWQSGIIDIANSTIAPNGITTTLNNVAASMGVTGGTGMMLFYVLGAVVVIWLIRKFFK